MSYTVEQLLDIYNSTVSALTPPPPPPVDNHNTLRVTMGDVYMAPGARIAYVPISLNEPVKQTEVFRVLTGNGPNGVNEGSYYIRTDKWIRFQPGEQFKVVAISTLKDLSSTQYFLLNAIAPQSTKNSTALTFADAVSKIHGDPALPRSLPIQVSDHPLPIKPYNLSLVFEETFGTSFVATDSGFLADGVTPCWRTQHGHGREQEAELGYYSDAIINPGTAPIIFENDKVTLQAEFHPDGVKDINGERIVDDTDPLGYYRYSASHISMQMFPIDVKPGTYVEVRGKMPVTKGTWPAVWFIPKKWWEWPIYEIDTFEGFWKNTTFKSEDIGTTVHWESSAGNHQSFYNRLPGLVDLNLPHTWGTWWAPDGSVEFSIDDVPYMKVPNVFTPEALALPGFLQITIAVGGFVGSPAADFTSAKFNLEFARIWQ